MAENFKINSNGLTKKKIQHYLEIKTVLFYNPIHITRWLNAKLKLSLLTLLPLLLILLLCNVIVALQLADQLSLWHFTTCYHG